MTTTTKTAPHRPALDREVATRLAAAEYDRVVEMLQQLDENQWASPTDCPGWDVRAVAGHLLGMIRMASSPDETQRQQLLAHERVQATGGLHIDALTALQVEENAALSKADLLERMREIAPVAVANRRGAPDAVRDATLPDPQLVGGTFETWTVGYLLDVILTRDPFLHRADIARATGAPMRLTADHEGVLVDDVVGDWARRHGRAFSLELTGPAGGQWQQGKDGDHLAMDALEFCRALSGRAPATGLLTTQVPF
jgi:uncharacterized protein (TIGR03083 family)